MSKSKRPSFANNLLISTPKQSSIDTSTPQKAIPGLFMNVEIDKIDFFDKNPRKYHAPEIYEQIKASIRASGVQQPVHITQRPNSDRYVLAQGGNTRLSIVKELYEETGDKRFASLPCIFVEYTNETDIQIAHLIENEQRQEMCFWDKAQAYAEVRDLFQSNVNKEMTQREAVTVFISHGLSVSQGLLSLFFFADRKLKHLGDLAQYLSNAKTTAISKTYNDLKKQFKDCKENEHDFEDWFNLSLSEFAKDSKVQDDLDSDALVAYLEQSFADYFEIQSSSLFDEQDNKMQNMQAENAVRHIEAIGEIFPTDSSPASQVQNDDIRPTRGGSGNLNEQDIQEVSPPREVAGNAPTRKVLHQTVLSLLQKVRLEECFCPSDISDLGFYVEYPDFDKIQKEAGNTFNSIDRRHEDAGDVLVLLMKISGQYQWLSDVENKQNPIFSLPENSLFKKSFVDVDFYDQINLIYVGERHLLSDKIIRWLSSNDDDIALLIQKIFALLKARGE